jgi:lipoyl(octanoyl) transferase
VITLGRGSKAEHLLASEAELAQAGIQLCRTGRGGDVTLHLPGQLVGYPILDLSPDRCDVRKYVRDLIETLRRVVGEYGVTAGSIEKYVGLWADVQGPGYWPGAELALEPKKLGAIGVKISRWVTLHGFALNVRPDLSMFRHIVPCGIREHGVTSVFELCGAAPSVRDAAERAFFHLANIFDRRPRLLRELRHGLSELECEPHPLAASS